MIAVAMTPRASAEVAGEIVQRRARSAALTERLAAVNADLHTARAARARAIAEGKKGPGAEIAALAEECAAIESALSLLTEDVATLEAEEQAAQLAEAEEAQRDAIADATTAMSALDATLREVTASAIAPAFDAYSAAMKAARNADDALDRLKRKASAVELPYLPGKSEIVTRRKTALLALIADVRRFVEDTP